MSSRDLANHTAAFHNLFMGNAIMARAVAFKSFFCGTKSLVVPATLSPGIAQLPGILFTLQRDTSVVLPGSLVNGPMPPLREIFWTQQGRVEALSPGLVCVMALLQFNAAHPQDKINQFWRHRNHVNVVTQLPHCPPKIATYAWKPGTASPPQIALLDPFEFKPTQPKARLNGKCRSVGHVGATNVPLHPASYLVHGRAMCVVCQWRNLKLHSQTPAVAHHRPITAREIMQSVMPAVETSTRAMLSSGRRVHLVCQLDAHASISLQDAPATAVHGTTIILHYRHYRHVYMQKQCTYNIMEGRPATAFGVHALMNGHQHHVNYRVWLERVRLALAEQAPYIDHYGRCGNMPDGKYLNSKPHEFMPHVSIEQAAKTGVEPWHLFITCHGGNLWLSRSFVIVRRHLQANTLQIRLRLVPPVDKLMPQTAGMASVRELPEQNGAKKDLAYPVFHSAEWLTYDWLAYLVENHQGTGPVAVVLEGSFARAVGGMHYREIQAGGTFAELVHIGLKGLFGTALHVDHKSDRNDPFHYATHPAAEAIAMAIRAEKTMLKSPETAHTSVLNMCERCGMPVGDGIEVPAMAAITTSMQMTLAELPWTADCTFFDSKFPKLMAKATAKGTLHQRNCIL